MLLHRPYSSQSLLLCGQLTFLQWERAMNCDMAPASSTFLLICTGSDGFATVLQPDSATWKLHKQPVWTYQPDPISVMLSTSGVTFSSTGSFFVNAATNMNSTSSSICYIVVIGANN